MTTEPGETDWSVRRVSHRDAPDLADLVDDASRFVADDVFRRAAMSCSATSSRDPSRFASVEALWETALTRGLRAPGFRMVRDGETVPVADVTRAAGIGDRTVADVIQPNRVLELYAEGATMVLQGLQLTDPHLARVANNLALALDHPVQVNAYLTPQGSRGLDLHFDYHDVFVVQLAGAKRWRVWEPLERTRDPVRAGRIGRPTFDQLGNAAFDLVLHAGDTLYLPRGFPHAAEAVDDSSAHLTIGLLAITWQRAVHQAVVGLDGDQSTSASIPIGGLGGRGPAVPPDRILSALEAALAPAHLARWMANEIWRRQPATRLRPLHPDPIDDDTAVTWTPGPLLWLTGDGGRARFGLGDRELSLPLETHRFLGALLASPGPVSTMSFATTLDDDSRRTVVRRLVAEGALVRA